MRVLGSAWKVLSARALTPVVIGLFLLLYVGIAFSAEDALMALINLVASSPSLIALFSLIPLNRGALLIRELNDFRARRRLLGDGTGILEPRLFEQTVTIRGAAGGFPAAARRLAGAGYRTRGTGATLRAWKGVTAFPARALFLAATALFFCGILLSLGGRVSARGNVIEGVALPALEGSPAGGVVRRIALEPSGGSLLAKTLSIEVAPGDDGEPARSFGLYPPSRYHGSFVYPRYLGIGLRYRLFAPDLPGGAEDRLVLSIYPPGKEDGREVEGTPYRLVFSLAQPADGSDPYTTGNFTAQFKLMRGNDLLCAGSAPAGGAFAKDGYWVEIVEVRRVVVTDFISDRGVYLVWLSSLFFVVAALAWLSVRVVSPRREMVFLSQGEGITASLRAEGRGRQTAGLFHELLDALNSADGPHGT